MEKNNTKMDLFIIDADNLVGNMCFLDEETSKLEILKGTKGFIEDLYNKIEEYRNIRKLDDITIMVTTSKGLQQYVFYQHLLNKLNQNLNIKFVYGCCRDYNISNTTVLATPNENVYTKYLTGKIDITRYLELLYYDHGLDNIIYISSNSGCFYDEDKLSIQIAVFDHKENFSYNNSYKIELKDSTIVKDAIPYNRNLVLKQINKLNKHFKDGNKYLKNIERDYRNCNIIYRYSNNVNFYEDDELVTSVNPFKIKKKEMSK